MFACYALSHVCINMFYFIEIHGCSFLFTYCSSFSRVDIGYVSPSVFHKCVFPCIDIEICSNLKYYSEQEKGVIICKGPYPLGPSIVERLITGQLLRGATQSPSYNQTSLIWIAHS